MKLTSNKKITSLLLCMMLIVAMALTAGCGGKKNDEPSGTQLFEGGTMGEGQTTFDFTVVDKEGKETVFEIHTDKTIVGDALQELGWIDGEESTYGLFIKSVNGIVADYDVDQTYWAFYINGEYAMSGVDTTQIEEGTVYSLKVEK